MKIKRWMMSAALALMITPMTNVFAASTQNFYFEDYTGDYYLTKLSDGTSNLHVKEVLTAVFPETDQNHGITRTIPYTNQDGKNRTIADQEALNLTVLRNGNPEPISKITSDDGYYTIYVGSASKYVHGEQVYTLEYDYTDVITEFDADGNNVSGIEDVDKLLQELYWDTNGTGWSQSFGKVTANLHATDDIYKNMYTDAWCYVGKYGDKGNERCTITPTKDGFSFAANDLTANENLTFVVEFQPDTFKVIIEKSYILVIALTAEIVICGLIILRKYLKWRKITKPKYDLYKALFTTPQYLPPEDKAVRVAEGEHIYMKKASSSYVATLLELAVSKKVSIKKIDGKKKQDWAIILNVEPEELDGPQKQMMNILSGNGGLKKGDEILVQEHTPTKYLANCAKDYRDKAIKTLESHGYLNKTPSANKMSAKNIIVVLVIMFMPMIIPIAAYMVFGAIEAILPDKETIIIGLDILPAAMAGVLAATIIVLIVFSYQNNKYKKYTDEGIKLEKYLEGLELYINMAEADRLKFLQSVEGADTSDAGIVKLHEKLLPWASLFGAEESWAKELEKYYKIESVENSIDLNVMDGIIASNIAHDVTKAIYTSTGYTQSSSGGSNSGLSGWSSGGSGGSWSSSSSGGGSFGGGSSGGGFSGGGGGGGGGGGW